MNSTVCPKCGREVPVMSYGYGYIAICCTKVLYYMRDWPEDNEKFEGYNQDERKKD
ncbi:MAG: hypothetical protein ACYDHW_04740 [Syntrophorhabdaceae bacterium]